MFFGVCRDCFGSFLLIVAGFLSNWSFFFIIILCFSYLSSRLVTFIVFFCIIFAYFSDLSFNCLLIFSFLVVIPIFRFADNNKHKKRWLQNTQFLIIQIIKNKHVVIDNRTNICNYDFRKAVTFNSQFLLIHQEKPDKRKV